MRRSHVALVFAVAAVSCEVPPPDPLPPDSFAFAVFGDGPYSRWENGRFQRVIEDVNRSDLEWFLHVGDILSHACSDEMFGERLQALSSIAHPVIYTPGDNEWTDCHASGSGGYLPLERLERLRATFFTDPGTSLGVRSLRLVSQSEDPAWPEYVENARWTRGGFIFATLHIVGSGNGTRGFKARTDKDDREVARRTAAAIAWLEETFVIAGSEGWSGVVLALHADVGLERGADGRSAYSEFVGRLEELTHGFAGPVLLIHGDSHEQRVDHPLVDRETGEPLPNFTRLETYGSPDIGWVRVVIDSIAGRVVAYEPRRMPLWGLR